MLDIDDLPRLEVLIEQASEERLLRIKALMLRRYGPEVLSPVDPMRTGGAQGQLSDRQLSAFLMHHYVRQRLTMFETSRLQQANPVFVQEAQICLKRAVSWREMLHIIDVGSVQGKLNEWHIGDDRKVVLFVEENIRDSWILGQADELGRQAEIVLCEEAGITLAYGAVSQSDKDDWIRAETAFRERADWTSAIIVTRPISGSTVWPRHNAGNRFCVAEHGLPAGSVTADDIETVRLFKNTTLLFEGSLHEAKELLRGMAAPERSLMAPTL